MSLAQQTIHDASPRFRRIVMLKSAMDDEFSNARDEALRKIGRAVVNFQKMEAMLKFMSVHSAIRGSIKDLQSRFDESSKQIAKKSMGKLAEAFLTSFYSQTDDVASHPTEITLSISIRAGCDADVAKERSKALRKVVGERNKLIHRTLARFDPGSIQSCEALSAHLDELQARIWPEFQLLASMVAALKEQMAGFQEYLASDQFLSDFAAARQSEIR